MLNLSILAILIKVNEDEETIRLSDDTNVRTSANWNKNYVIVIVKSNQIYVLLKHSFVRFFRRDNS